MIIQKISSKEVHKFALLISLYLTSGGLIVAFTFLYFLNKYSSKAWQANQHCSNHEQVVSINKHFTSKTDISKDVITLPAIVSEDKESAEVLAKFKASVEAKSDAKADAKKESKETEEKNETAKKTKEQDAQPILVNIDLPPAVKQSEVLAENESSEKKSKRSSENSSNESKNTKRTSLNDKDRSKKSESRESENKAAVSKIGAILQQMDLPVPGSDNLKLGKKRSVANKKEEKNIPSSGEKTSSIESDSSGQH